MRKNLKKLGILFTLMLTLWGCQDDEKSFGDIHAPSDLEASVEIVGQDNDENPNGDGSGLVDFKASAQNAISYKYIFSDGTTMNAPSGQIRKRFNLNGLNTYTVTLVANGKGGVSSSISFEVTVFSNFTDEVSAGLLTGGATKKWYWAASEPGHLGVGQNDGDSERNYYPNYYAAAPFEKAGSPDSSCLYDNELTFTLENETIKFELNNGGRTFANASYVGQLGGGGGSDLCVNYNETGVKTVTLGPSESVVAANNIPSQTTGTAMTFSDGGFMGYYIGQSTYEILSITENRMTVRAVMGNDPGLAWYHTFSTSPPNQGGGGEEPNYTNLVWADEFDVDGAPNPSNWSYNIGRGENGWGNNESQFYTDRRDNSIVENGLLKIILKAENHNGASYTSARLVSENKFEFTYGKIEVRAKLPSGGGTWPAIWMLGENYPTNQWPACGEIDIMEHKGNEPNIIHGTLHYPGNSGGNANGNTTTISNVSSEFHTYSVIWSPTSIRFFVDDQPAFHSFINSPATPFNSDFFMILNVAMGGTFGGNIAPGFTQSTMEVDYVRVYQ